MNKINHIIFKHFLTISILIFPLNCSYQGSQDFIDLGGKWKLSAKDNLEFKELNYSDLSWQEADVPKRLEKQGYKDFLGIGWYRKSVNIPSNFNNDLLGIYFSNIADSDEVYFNGFLIGKSGSFEKNGSITPHYSKIYSIPEKLINRDGPNLIAVRFDKRYGPFIGIFNKSPVVGYRSMLEKRVIFENSIKSYFIFFGAVIILLLGFYHLILFSHLRTKTDYLFFSLTCIFGFFFEASVSFIPYSIFNNLAIVTKIHIISLILGVTFLFWFVFKYFGIKSKTIIPYNLSIASVFCLITLFIRDPNSILKTSYIYFVFAILLIFWMFFASMKKTGSSTKRGNIFLKIGMTIVLLTSINDVLITYGAYYFYLVNAYGFLYFVIGISVSLANEFASTYKAEKLKANTLENINKVSLNLSSELNFNKLIENSIDLLKKQLQIARSTIILTGDGGLSNSNESRTFGDDLKEPLSEISWVFEEAQTSPYIMKDMEDTFSGHIGDGGKKKGEKYHRELMIAPMIHGKKVIGLIALSKKLDGTKFNDDDKEFVSIIAPQLALAVENATAYREIEDEVKKQRDMLIMSEKMAAIGQLTSGIGHEINNPINFIISYVPPVRENVQALTEVLQLYEKLHFGDGGTESDKNQILGQIEEIMKKEKLEAKLPRILRSLDAITDGANRVASIVDSLKAYARTDAQAREININEAIDKSIIILTNKLKNRIEINKDYAQDLTATCYSSINQVIVNLLSNAADAIEEKGSIWIKTQNLKDKIRLIIKDDGKGMSEDTRKRLFTPFFTTKGPGKGTGLGLSITYNIVYDQHHGTIEVDSWPGKGSTFTVTIPKDVTFGKTA